MFPKPSLKNHVSVRLKRNLVAALKRCTTCLPENSWLHKKIVLLRTDGTLENYVLKSICGFFAGVFLTYMFFVFFVFQLHFALTSATVICSIVGIILTLGLAFSPRVRYNIARAATEKHVILFYNPLTARPRGK